MAAESGAAAADSALCRWRRLAFAAPLLLAACASLVAQRAETALLEALPAALGPAERYEARVEGASADGSRFERVRAAGLRVQRPDAPVIERLEVVLEQVVVDRPTRRIVAIGQAQATATLTAAALTAHLEQRAFVRAPEVRFAAPDRVFVSGRLAVPPGGASTALVSPVAAVEGRIVPVGPRLQLAVEALRFGDRAAPPFVRGVVQAALPPLLDLGAWATPARIDRVEVSPGAIRLDASGSGLVVTDRRPAGAALPAPGRAH